MIYTNQRDFYTTSQDWKSYVVYRKKAAIYVRNPDIYRNLDAGGIEETHHSESDILSYAANRQMMNQYQMAGTC